MASVAVVVVSAIAAWVLQTYLGVEIWLLPAVVLLFVLAWKGRSPGGANDIGDQRSAEAEAGEVRLQESVVLPIEDSIDLHAFSPRDIPEVVLDYLEAAHGAGYREVRLIHGRGTGFQRERVRQVLTDHPLVVSFRDAPPQRGGWGASIVCLRR